MRPDRAFQRQILEHLRDMYPSATSRLDERFQNRDDLWAQVHYLAGYGLVEGEFTLAMGGKPRYASVAITSQGIDFLEDDGGLRAILGVVTVKLHADTIRDLLAKQVEAASLPPEEKATLLARLKRLPVEALDKLTMKLLDAGAERSLDLLRGWLDQLGA